MIGLLTQLSPQEKIDVILKEFDLYPHHLETIGNVQKLHTQRGAFALKKTEIDSEQIEILQSILKKLDEKQYPHFLMPLQNKYGDTFIPLLQEYYYVTPWIEDKTELKYRDKWENDMLTAMAQLHRLSMEFVNQLSLRRSLSPDKILNRWNTRLHQMNEYRIFAQERQIMSPVESVFVNHFEYLTDLSLRAVKYLKQWEGKAGQGATAQTVLCHGNIFRNHVLHPKKNHFYFINFDHARLDSPARDLALFFRRHMDKAFEWEGTAMEWLSHYEQEFPLTQEDRTLLAIYLLFPEKVYKEIENYYQAVRPWHPLKHARFLEKQIKHTYSIRRFVKEMLS